ncbi:MAG: o-succinylbenzoate--CoA ligase [Bacteroidota bacterium]
MAYFDPIRTFARERGETTALEDHRMGTRHTYAQLDRLITGTAGALASRGVGPGSRIALRPVSSPETLILLWALLRLRAVGVLINLREPAASVVERMASAGAEWLISPAFGDLDAVSPEALMAEPASGLDADLTFDLDAPATVVFTSGSTGQPKPALHTLGNHVFSALGSQTTIPVDETTRWLLVLPLFHVGGLAIVMRTWLHGGTVVLPNDARDLAGAIELLQPTHLSAVATQWRTVLDHSPSDSRSLRHVLLGGSAISRPLIEESRQRGYPIHVSYGSTEMASQIATTPASPGMDDLRTSGYLIPHRELRIDEKGELLVRGRTRFLGYLDAGNLARPFDAEGWFATGDRGQIDDEGRLIVLGRTDRMFISGGENVHPEEIERALLQLPGVRRALVIGLEDAVYGQTPVAVIDGPVLDSKRLTDALRDVLPGYKIPRRLLAWPADIPEGMKPDLQALEAWAASELAG